MTDWAAAALDDPTVLDELAEALPASVMNQMLTAFAADIDQRRAEWTAALDRADLTAATKAAHSLKGAALNLGFLRLGAIAADLQELGKQGDGAAMTAMTPQFLQVCDRSQERLKAVQNTRDLPSRRIRL